MNDTARPANRLASETSPYLLQHAHNPVDWFPWGDEAFEEARRADKPIFLSVGYSACHWCHVMERESFEDESIARLMNDLFVCVKVDREERPDVDAIYMNAVQAISGHGGWPMSVFLTPDGRPFFGGTYYPPRDARGMPGFPRVLEAVHRAWADRREEIVASSTDLTRRLEELGSLPASEGPLDEALLDGAARAIARSFEPRHGGFGSAPKFPHPMALRFLLRHHKRTGDAHSLHIVRHTLDHMARGGIYDHLGGGFARYSTDERWLVPHFEKMLYDNALLATTYLETFQLSGDEEFARVARETMDYVLGRMASPEGGIYSTEDADSEGVEGKYYVWTLEEVREVLGDERAAVFARVYDVTDRGNWEGRNILNLPVPIAQAASLFSKDEVALRAELDACRADLLACREGRVPPGKDTKVLTSWNGLMIGAWAEGSRILGEPRYLGAAERAAGFLMGAMLQEDGRLLHSYKDGRARFNAYLDDYANLIDGLTRLFEAGGEPRWLRAALDLTAVMIREFHDAEAGGFFYTGHGHEALITRQKDAYDNATPSGTAMAATALARLGALAGREDLEELARETLASVRVLMERAPSAAGQSLIALDFLLGAPLEVAIVSGNDPSEFNRAMAGVYKGFRPRQVVAPKPAGADEAGATPLLAGRPTREGRTTVYVCERFACKEPVFVEGLEAALS